MDVVVRVSVWIVYGNLTNFLVAVQLPVKVFIQGRNATLIISAFKQM